MAKAEDAACPSLSEGVPLEVAWLDFQASLVLRPAGSLSRPRRPLSRGFSPAGYPTKPLVSYRTYRQLSVWNPPPLVIRAFGAHYQKATFSAPPSFRYRLPKQAPCSGTATMRGTLLLGWGAGGDFRFGSTSAKNPVTNFRLLYPRKQTLML